MDYEQMELDIRLDSEIDLKDNVSKVIQFTVDKRRAEAEDCGHPLPAVRNKHEGYGIAAEAWDKVQSKEKEVKNGMNLYLGLLQVKGEDAVRACSSIYDAALNLATEAISMAADASRILSDLYYGVPQKTPIEEAIDASTQEAGEGFEDAEPISAEYAELEGDSEAQDEAGEDGCGDGEEGDSE